jgi:dsDNA-binding SOS-regulon protein
MEDTGMNWRKPSRSNGGGNACVEVANTARTVSVRDSKDRHGFTLSVNADAWRAFTENAERIDQTLRNSTFS